MPPGCRHVAKQVIAWPSLISLAVPGGRSGPGRGGPDRRRRPRPDGTKPVMCAWFERAGRWGTHAGDQGQRLHRGMSLAQTPPGLPLNKAIARRGSLVGAAGGVSLLAKVRHAERRCPHERRVRVHVWATRRKVCARVAVTSGLSLEGSPYDVSRQGCRRSSVPRKTR